MEVNFLLFYKYFMVDKIKPFHRVMTPIHHLQTLLSAFIIVSKLLLLKRMLNHDCRSFPRANTMGPISLDIFLFATMTIHFITPMYLQWRSPNFLMPC